MKVLVAYRTISSSQRWGHNGYFRTYDGIDFVEPIYKDHRRLKREKRRQRKGK